MEYGLKRILDYLKDQRGFDFSGYRTSMLERRIEKRIFATQSKNLDDYFKYVKNFSVELDQLIDVFTINVSRFFRNSFIFEYISKMIIPSIIQTKIKNDDLNFRVWSAGCSFGEEPYSMAILLNEIINKEEVDISVNIFATDLDKKAITRASKGVYDFDSIKNVKIDTFQKYFTKTKNRFQLDPEIKKMVQFSFHDLLDENRLVPPDSIFGGFDIVLCRNVLIYFEPEYQKIIFNKLYKSLNKNGYLILGEAEVPIEGFKNKFSRENKCCKIYRKIG